MLTAIELAGFKSFADRTRLEFADGISALVGPNGSGKSNIVDAIKWVLGEQSNKKLRASEATDVIFNGCGGREPLGMAEVTLTFDNSTKIFPELDTREVHITRRVYRSGEGEYLLNRQASRLRDLKEILAGTGLGTQAYSIIEQGRVESLLQSNPLQRRGIFEDAAGISRFQTKENEAGKRLDRVEQNMVRLADIRGEVEQQLKAAKSQASKAESYRTLAARLQELRTEAALVDFRRLHNSLAESREKWDAAQAKRGELTTNVEQLESEIARCVSELESLDMAMRTTEKNAAATTERIAAEKIAAERLLAQQNELYAEIAQGEEQLLALKLKSGGTDDLVRKTQQDINLATETRRELQRVYEETHRVQTALEEKLIAQQNEQKILAQKNADTQKRREELQREISNHEMRRSALAETLARQTQQISTLDETHAQLTFAKAKFTEAQTQLAQQVKLLQTEIDALRTRKQKRSTKREGLANDISELKQRSSALTERASVLDDLLKRHDGLSPGVKEVLRLAKNPESPFRHAHGLVADIFHVDIADAPLIDWALGAKAQQVVVSPEPELFRHIENTAQQFPGRVGFIWLDPRPAGSIDAPSEQFSRRAGVLGRADQFIRTTPFFVPLAQRLLGHIWIVESLTIAKKLYRESDDRTSFITTSGEMLEADGTLVVGPQHAAAGQIARRSELRSVNEEQTALAARIAEMELSLQVTNNRLTCDEEEQDAAHQQHRAAVKEHDAKEIEICGVEKRLLELDEQKKSLIAEREKLERELEVITQKHNLGEEELRTCSAQCELLQDEIRVLESQHATLESEIIAAVTRVTTAKIDLAKSEERLDALQDRLAHIDSQREERLTRRREQTTRRAQCRARRESLELIALQHHAAIATLYSKSESFASAHAEQVLARQQFSEQRKKRQSEFKKRQSELQNAATQTHTFQLETERLEQEKKTLTSRVYEDYGLHLAELELAARATISADSQSAMLTDSQQEIDDLRQKIQKLGYVNLESIETLDALTARYDSLSQQYNDLLAARRSAERLRERILVDSRRMFADTFDGVKLHFREIFQQLFGGGNADLILDNPDAPMESGIEIVARPPGKELRSVMLMSGGEKTMTCVALLLAFFKFRPNPVCILDEVDAALDEGNTDRFVRVMREFRLNTQFLIITHSKKTMACATTLYGITMQESGVSKPISVRFIDVGEHGEIVPPTTSAQNNLPEDSQENTPMIFSLSAATEKEKKRAA